MAESKPKLERLTLTIPEDVIQKAKHRAITDRTSVSKQVTEFLRKYGDGDKNAPAAVAETKADYTTGKD